MRIYSWIPFCSGRRRDAAFAGPLMVAARHFSSGMASAITTIKQRREDDGRYDPHGQANCRKGILLRFAAERARRLVTGGCRVVLADPMLMSRE